MRNHWLDSSKPFNYISLGVNEICNDQIIDYPLFLKHDTVHSYEQNLCKNDINTPVHIGKPAAAYYTYSHILTHSLEFTGWVGLFDLQNVEIPLYVFSTTSNGLKFPLLLPVGSIIEINLSIRDSDPAMGVAFTKGAAYIRQTYRRCY